MSVLDEFLDERKLDESLLAIDVGNCLIIRVGWLEEVLTYNKMPLDSL